MRGAALRSPVSGRALVEDTSHSLCDEAGERWPVVDGIPFLRTGRPALARAALACLDRGDPAGALIGLLGDQDDWWTGPAASSDALADLVANRESLTLRDAMDRLAFGRVGDYFGHRWSDPTFLAGLALLEAHWRPAATAFELACGIGHYGREILRRGVAYTGADVVFAKLWLARWWVLGRVARLVCFDASAPWPLAGAEFDLALCQDAFYFLEPKPLVLERMRGLTAPKGWIVVGHVHNREAPNWSSGAAIDADALAELFPDGVFYDDAELTKALVEARRPEPRPPDQLRGAEAFAVAAGSGLAPTPRPLTGGFCLPAIDGAGLRLNPLYRACRGPCPEPATETPRNGPRLEDPGFASGGDEAWEIVWPSECYREEYQRLATYPPVFARPRTSGSIAEAVRRRALVDLPERW